MNHLRKIIFAHLIIVISLLLCSCGTQHSIRDDVIYQDDNFGYDRLISNGIVIGGVASKEIKFTNDERIKYGSLLSNILIEQLKAVQIINTLQLIGKIGKENYFRIMGEFDADKILLNDDIRAIEESIPEIEYIILSYIKNENIRNKSYTETTADDKGEYKTVFETTYSIAVEFQIYDVFKEKIVWNNIMYNEAVKIQSRTEDSLLGVVVGDVMSEAFVNIDRKDVLEEIYQKFAEGLVETNN